VTWPSRYNILASVRDHDEANVIPLKDFLPKLKRHLLPRMLAKLSSHKDPGLILSDPQNFSPDSILFKHDRIYKHGLLRINYTTYDVRRSQDVVNASTSHRDVMLLAADVDAQRSPHPFRYARVLGIYHANIVYVGPGMLNYQTHRFEFLWV
jgi:hypothetical protein